MDLTLIVRLGFRYHLRRSRFLLGLFRNVAVAEVFPEATIARDRLKRIESFGREPWHARLFGIAINDIGPPGFVLILRPEEILRLIANRIEVFFNIKVKL